MFAETAPCALCATFGSRMPIHLSHFQSGELLTCSPNKGHACCCVRKVRTP